MNFALIAVAVPQLVSHKIVGLMLPSDTCIIFDSDWNPQNDVVSTTVLLYFICFAFHITHYCVSNDGYSKRKPGVIALGRPKTYESTG